ncbi:unnamed protein product, partial [Ilex paraguariensis]
MGFPHPGTDMGLSNPKKSQRPTKKREGRCWGWALEGGRNRKRGGEGMVRGMGEGVYAGSRCGRHEFGEEIEKEET